MKNEIIEIIASVAEVPVKNVKMESNLINDLELGSLDLVTLVSEFENKYNMDDNRPKTVVFLEKFASYCMLIVFFCSLSIS